MNEDHLELGLKILQEISTFLSNNANRPFSIEIVPSATPRSEEEQQQGLHLLIDEDAAAIRKRDLLSAFLLARRCLLSRAPLINGCGKSEIVTGEECPPRYQLAPDQIDPYLASWVVSLYDPEHLTAANYRKRLLKTHDCDEQDGAKLGYLRLELNLTKSILTSPLHKHSKSPTLWFQRLWLMKQFRPWQGKVFTDVIAHKASETLNSRIRDAAPPVDPTARSLEFWLCELQVVLSAAEQHERNYPAFQYLRELFVHISTLDVGETGISLAVAEILMEASSRVSRWSLQHPRDISALTCLAWLLRQAQKHGAGKRQIREIVDGVKAFQSKLHWQGDGIRVFLLMAEDLG